jgi:hypothetical protein
MSTSDEEQLISPLLIQAAPDLLEASKMALNIFRDFDLEHLCAFWLLVKAINKAEGITED